MRDMPGVDMKTKRLLQFPAVIDLLLLPMLLMVYLYRNAVRFIFEMTFSSLSDGVTTRPLFIFQMGSHIFLK